MYLTITIITCSVVFLCLLITVANYFKGDKIKSTVEDTNAKVTEVAQLVDKRMNELLGYVKSSSLDAGHKAGHAEGLAEGKAESHEEGKDKSTGSKDIIKTTITDEPLKVEIVKIPSAEGNEEKNV